MLAALCAPAIAEDQKPAPLDPTTVVRQLYLLSDREHSTSAHYIMWGDGSITLTVDLTRNISVSGNGATLEEALADLRRQSTELSATAVPKAEQTKTLADSLVEGIKAMLIGGRSSQ